MKNTEREAMPPTNQIDLEEPEGISLIQDPEPFRAAVPLRLYEDSTCRQCGEQFRLTPDHTLPDAGLDPLNYQLCISCFSRLLLTGTVEGRTAVEDRLVNVIPPAYRDAEFNRFQTYEPFRGHLARVRHAVITWCQDVVDYYRSWGKITYPGSLYVFSQRDAGWSGNGTGKTFLLFSAFKFLARRLPKFVTSPADFGEVGFSASVMDVQDLADKFLDRRQQCEAQDVPTYSYTRADGFLEFLPFDAYVLHLAKTPVMLFDDIGRPPCTTMVQHLYDRILDLRVGQAAPMLFTSNFNPDELGDVVGTRVKSRVFRGGCLPIEIRVPDFALQQLKHSEQP